MNSNTSISDQLTALAADISVKGRLVVDDRIATLLEEAYYELDDDKSIFFAVMAGLKLPTKRSFTLGSVENLYGTAYHRVVRRERGAKWRLFVDSADFPDGEALVGDYTAEEIFFEIDCLGYDLPLSKWILMGWRLQAGESV